MPAPLVFDRSLVRLRRQRAYALGPATFLIDRIAEDLAERLSVILRRFTVAVDLGSATDAVRRVLMNNPVIQTMIAVDANTCCLGDSGLRVAADEELLPFADGALDLVVSALTLQSVNDLPGVLVQIRRSLKPDGLFLAALLGGDTLAELRHSFAAAETEIEGGLSPRIAPFPDVRDMGVLLQRAGFALPVTDVDRLTIRYASPLALLHDLRRMGATNALTERRRSLLRRATLARMLEIYSTEFSDADGKVRATFEVLWLSGWSPHESQQQPLRPGSARSRLADALGTTEASLDDKAGR
jgi:SAM-dependent methyltransferase